MSSEIEKAREWWLQNRHLFKDTEGIFGEITRTDIPATLAAYHASRTAKCKLCNGLGWINGNLPQTTSVCPWCRGTGETPALRKLNA